MKNVKIGSLNCHCAAKNSNFLKGGFKKMKKIKGVDFQDFFLKTLAN